MKIIITGKATSGKDYLLNLFRNNKYKVAIKYTTRPPRENEKNNIDYYFTNNKEFDILKNNNQMVVHQEFNIDGDIWQYGFTKNDFNIFDIFILTPVEIAQLPIEIRNQFKIIYLNIDINERIKRLKERNDYNDNMQNRIVSDELQFKGFSNYDIEICNSNFKFEDILDLIYN